MLTIYQVVVTNMSDGIFSPMEALQSTHLLTIPGNAGVLYALFKMPVVATIHDDDTRSNRGWVGGSRDSSGGVVSCSGLDTLYTV